MPRSAGAGGRTNVHRPAVDRRRGADYMDLGTSEEDVAARALYGSLGFDNHQGRSGGPVNYSYERLL